MSTRVAVRPVPSSIIEPSSGRQIANTNETTSHLSLASPLPRDFTKTRTILSQCLFQLIKFGKRIGGS